MAADDAQLGKLERPMVEVRNWPPRLGWRERTGMTDLEADRDVELYALRVQRIIAAIVGRQVPQPRQNAKCPEAEFAERAAQLANRGHRATQIDGRDPS
jgi:hypothetical protein